MEWIYFIHPPRAHFAATMTAEESAVWERHFARLQAALADGLLVLAGPTTGSTNIGVCIFRAPDEASAQRFMEEDPVVAGGYARAELHPFRVSLIQGS